MNLPTDDMSDAADFGEWTRELVRFGKEHRPHEVRIIEPHTDLDQIEPAHLVRARADYDRLRRIGMPHQMALAGAWDTLFRAIDLASPNPQSNRGGPMRITASSFISSVNLANMLDKEKADWEERVGRQQQPEAGKVEGEPPPSPLPPRSSAPGSMTSQSPPSDAAETDPPPQE